jgi:hypothetical protein
MRPPAAGVIWEKQRESASIESRATDSIMFARDRSSQESFGQESFGEWLNLISTE